MTKFMISAVMFLFLALPLPAAVNLLEHAELKAHPYPDRISQTIDKNLETHWLTYTAGNATGTIQAVFPDVALFDAVAVYGNNLHRVELEVSDDGVTWSSAGTLDNANGTVMAASHFPDGLKAKAVKLNITGGADPAAVAVRELKIYSIDGEPHKALFRKISETGDGLNWRTPAMYYIDGNDSTGSGHWSAYKGSVVEIDLGAEEEIQRVVLNGKNGFDSVSLSISVDASNFKPAAETAGRKAEQVMEFTPVKARYLRFDLTGNHGSGLQEIRVF